MSYVCLSLYIGRICAGSLKVMNGLLMRFSGGLGRGRTKNRLDFGGDPDSFVEPGSCSTVFSLIQDSA